MEMGSTAGCVSVALDAAVVIRRTPDGAVYALEVTAGDEAWTVVVALDGGVVAVDGWERAIDYDSTHSVYCGNKR